MKNQHFLFLLFGIALVPFDSVRSQVPTEPAPLKEVHLLDSPFKQAQDWDRAYMLKLDPDRLLNPYRREAGLPAKAESYPNWENSGLDGHTAGHYLSALAFMWASTGDPELLTRLNYMVSELAECQKANKNGYVGSIPGSRDYWSKIAAGDVALVWKRWAPWYTLHKTFAGLRDAWLVGGNAQARTVLIHFADWTGDVVSKLSDQQMQTMLANEHGGMNEVLADVFTITGDSKYLDLAKRFNHQTLLGPLKEHQDRLDGLHANTQIPKVVGFEKIGKLSHDNSLCDAARFFWKAVTQNRSVAFGGNSVNEHFNPKNDFSSMFETRAGPESCNSYNMVKLTQELFNLQPDARYMDFVERVLYNHILTTIDGHGFVYFTPVRPGQYRTYSTVDQSFWCCVGTGMENHGKYGEFIYAVQDKAAYVNLFIPSEFHWKQQGMTIRQETQFPNQEKSTLLITTEASVECTLLVRHPSWVAEKDFQVSINDEIQNFVSPPSSFVSLKRVWKSGDRIEIQLPMHLYYEKFPDGKDDVAFLLGPLVLAASLGQSDMPDLYAGAGRWDHVSNQGALLPLAEAPILVCPGDSIIQCIKALPGKDLTYTLGDSILPQKYQNIELVPFYKLAECRYAMYFQHFTPEDYQGKIEKLRNSEKDNLTLENATMDRVAPGEQQPEVDHHFLGAQTENGFFQERHWRDATDWFSYDLKLKKGKAAELYVTYWGGDSGRKFFILANDQKIAEVDLASRGHEFYSQRYSIPDSITSHSADGVITIKFMARMGSRAGGVFDVRLLEASQQTPK